MIPDWFSRQMRSELYFAVDAELQERGVEDLTDEDERGKLLDEVEEELKTELRELADLVMTEITGTYF